MPLIDTITAFSTGSYTVTRTAAETWSGGFATPGAPSTFPITASIRPATGRQLQRPAEGQYGDEVMRIRTTTELRARGPSGPGDRLTIDGETYEVFSVRRNPSMGPHYHALAARLVTP